MSKKMKRVAFDLHEDVNARAKFKHQTLLQDYVELQQETEAARNNLMALKQKKLTLQAEVRFLRQRHKFLLKNKSSTPQEQVFMKSQPTRYRKCEKEKARFEKQKTLYKFPHTEKKKPPRSIPSPEFDLFLGKEKSVQRAIANQRVRVNGPKASPFLDLSKKDGFFGSQELVGQIRKPVIDLNRISREEEEFQEQCEPLDPSIRNGFDVSMFRNNVGGGSGSSGRAGKRKISWQDHVDLRVSTSQSRGLY